MFDVTHARTPISITRRRKRDLTTYMSFFSTVLDILDYRPLYCPSCGNTGHCKCRELLAQTPKQLSSNMPSLHGAGISIRLASQPLAASLTEHVELKRGFSAASKIEQAEKALLESVHTLLLEERVPFPGEEGNFSLNWIGDVPFFQVAIGQPSERSQLLAKLKQRMALRNELAATKTAKCATRGVSTRSGRVFSSDDTVNDGNCSSEARPVHGLPIDYTPFQPSSNSNPEPKALALHVMLTDKSFFHSPFSRAPQHLKIDVLFNGKLASCVLLHPRDIQSGAKSFNQVFAGTRVDYMAERPWVIHEPPASMFAGSRPQGATEPETQERWEEICKALMSEANERRINGNGERPPSAAYLRELASM